MYHAQLWDGGINLSLLQVVTIYLIFPLTRKQNNYPQYLRWKKTVFLHSSHAKVLLCGDLERKPDLCLMFRGKLPSVISSSLAFRWHSLRFIPSGDGKWCRRLGAWVEIPPRLERDAVSPPSTRGDLGCMNIHWLGILSWFDIKNNTIKPGPSPKYWLLVICFVLSLSCLWSSRH